MEKRTFLTVAICVLIFVAWQRFYIKPIVDAQNAYKAVQQSQDQSQAKSKVDSQTGVAGTRFEPLAPSMEAKKALLSGTKSREPKEIILNEDAPRIVMTTVGAAVLEYDIEQYKGKKLERINDLVMGPNMAELYFLVDGGQELRGFVYDAKSTAPGQAVFYYEDEKVKVQRKVQFDRGKLFLEFENSVQVKPNSGIRFAIVALKTKKDIGKLENERREINYSFNNKKETFSVEDLKDRKEDAAELDWIAVTSRYFLSGLTHAGGVKPQFYAASRSENIAEGSFIYRIPEGVLEFKNRLFVGPKDVDLLKQVDTKISTVVDFGWFTFFAYPLLQGLKWFNKYVHNFGVAIILLTILVKLALYPLTYKSMKSMKEMQRIQPQIQKLREKYGDNKEQLNKEMLSLMRSNGYNPLSGCLPVLVQMPIFIALYNVLYNSIELYGQPFFGWISDLSQKDPYFVTPILLALVMFIQQKMTPATTMDPAQQRMMNMMPVIFGAMMLWLPAGLTLYMLVNSVVSIAQQIFINRSFARAGLA